jgi:hypothetical protein
MMTIENWFSFGTVKMYCILSIDKFASLNKSNKSQKNLGKSSYSSRWSLDRAMTWPSQTMNEKSRRFHPFKSFFLWEKKAPFTEVNVFELVSFLCVKTATFLLLVCLQRHQRLQLVGFEILRIRSLLFELFDGRTRTWNLSHGLYQRHNLFIALISVVYGGFSAQKLMLMDDDFL